MLKFDQERAQRLAMVFTAQELDWLTDRLPAVDEVAPNQARVLEVLYEAFSLAVEQFEAQ